MKKRNKLVSGKKKDFLGALKGIGKFTRKDRAKSRFD